MKLERLTSIILVSLYTLGQACFWVFGKNIVQLWIGPPVKKIHLRGFLSYFFSCISFVFCNRRWKASSGNCPKHRDGVMCEISFCVDDVQVLYSSDLEAQNKKAHFRTNQELWSLPENVFKGSIIIRTQETNNKKEQLCEWLLPWYSW